VTEIHETELPGIGVRQEFDTVSGTRLGVLTTRTGRKELLLYDREDPDSCRATVHLDPEDSVVLAGLLGSSRVDDAATGLQRLEGLAIDWLTVPRDSSAAGRTIGENRIRKTTGASVVAIVRGQDTNAAPGPDDVLEPGDVLVSVGTPEAVDALLGLLQAG
jgi:TrkA domain protein